MRSANNQYNVALHRLVQSAIRTSRDHVWDYEHIGRRVGAVVHTAEGAGRIEVVVVAPIGSVADMAVAVADHNLAEAAAGSIVAVVVLDLDKKETSATVDRLVNEAAGLGAGEEVCYILLVLVDKGTRARHMEPAQVVGHKATEAGLVTQGAEGVVVVQAAHRVRVAVPGIAMAAAGRRCSLQQRTMLSCRRVAWCCGWRVWLQTDRVLRQLLFKQWGWSRKTKAGGGILKSLQEPRGCGARDKE